MTIQFFTELSRSKGLVLIRCELRDQVMVKQDCMFSLHMLMKYYIVQSLFEQYVEKFNKQPGSFDYHMYLKQMRDEAGATSVQIQDKKFSGVYSASSSITIPEKKTQQLLQPVPTTDLH